MDFTPPPEKRRAPRHPRYDAIHRALLTGLLSNTGTRGDGYEYTGTRGTKFNIFPGSALFGQKPRWIVAAELVETAKLYGRTVGAVEPQWIERAAGDLVERTHSEPRWDARSGSVIATERVTLYSLVLVAARIVPFGPINAKIAREIFIHHALVLAEMRTDGAFLQKNAALVAEVELLEAKIRQRNLLADIATRYAFYDARVPLKITNVPDFERWRRTAERDKPGFLLMSKEDLLRADAPSITPENYPEKISDIGGGVKMPVAYRYEPGDATDGLTITVPVAALGQLSGERYEWLVPGMLEEKISAMLRGLPGSLRRNFVPVPQWAKAAAIALAVRDKEAPTQSLKAALASFLAAETGTGIHAEDFLDDALPPFMRMNFKVIDDQGKILGAGRELGALQRRLAVETAGSFASIDQQAFQRQGISTWTPETLGDLPETRTVQRFNMSIVGYPALVDAGETVSLKLLPSKEGAAAAHRAGVRRLFRIAYRREIKAMRTHIPGWTRMALQYWLLGPTDDLREDLVTLIVDRALFAEGTVPRTVAGFHEARLRAAERLLKTGEQVAGVVGDIMERYHQLTLLLLDMERAEPRACTDVRDHLAILLASHFLLPTPFEWLEQFPRYLSAMRTRLEKLTAGGGAHQRDADAMDLIRHWQNLYSHRAAAHAAIHLDDPELSLFRWMLEEYRVSLFAQELGTLFPISNRRLERAFEKVRK